MNLAGLFVLAMVCGAAALLGWLVRSLHQFEREQAHRRLASFDALCYRLQLEREDRNRQLERELAEMLQHKEKAPE